MSVMSDTLAYSMISQMYDDIEPYIGKTIRMTGVFNVLETADRNYYNCLVMDATQCCGVGFEFLPAGNHTYPNDYPQMDQTITVTGVLDVYYEDGYPFYQLIDAKMEF